MPRMAFAFASLTFLLLPGCMGPNGPAKRWEVSFGVSVESKIDENNTVKGSFQVGTPKPSASPSPTSPKVKP
jgi:hypothetical protein